MAVNEDQVLEALSKVAAPDGTPLTRAGVLSPIVANDGKVFFSINVDAAEARAWDSVRAQAEAAVKALPGVTAAMIALTAERQAGNSAPAGRAGAVPPGTPPRPKGHARGHAHPHGSPMARQAPIPGVGSIVAVASGKGGVGKSTTALNLALGLAALGRRVGILDADIYGPSLPRLTAITERPQTRDGRVMIPIERFGLRIMSIGFLVDEATPMIWRGPMVMSAVTQMLREVEWGVLDVLVVDMPPGTGDAQLTLAQTVPVTGAVIVSTPQDLALIDARRGAAMFERVNIPVLGVIENMSYFVCPHCGTRSDIFGHGGAREEARKLGLAFLGEVPLHMDIRSTSDAGAPLTATKPDSPHAQIYRTIAERVAEQLAVVKGR